MSFLLITILLQLLYSILACSYTFLNMYRIHDHQVPLSSTNPSLAFKFISLLLIIICLGLAGYLWIYICATSVIVLLIICGSCGLIDSLRAYKYISQNTGYSSRASLISAILIDLLGVASFSGGFVAAVHEVI